MLCVQFTNDLCELLGAWFKDKGSVFVEKVGIDSYDLKTGSEIPRK